MSFSSADLLQFEELKELLARYAGSTAGRDLVHDLEPRADRFALTSALAETGEAIAYLRELSGPQTSGTGNLVRLRFDHLRDIATPVRILQVEGASLDGPAILDLFHNLALAGEYRGGLLSDSERFTRFV